MGKRTGLKMNRKEVVTLTVAKVSGEVIEPSLPVGLRNLAIT